MLFTTYLWLVRGMDWRDVDVEIYKRKDNFHEWLINLCDLPTSESMDASCTMYCEDEFVFECDKNVKEELLSASNACQAVFLHQL